MDPIDRELLDVINRLNKIQTLVGGAKEKGGADGGKGSTGPEKVDFFIDLRNKMIDNLNVLKEKIELSRNPERLAGSNSRELLTIQSDVRSGLNSLSSDWQELNTLFMSEKRKKKSKIPAAELTSRENDLVQLQQEINSLKDMQRAGYVRDYKPVALVKMEDSEAFKPRTGDSKDSESRAARNNNITDRQRLALVQIKKRDQQIDEEIELIGQGVDELGEIARAANEEIKLQSVMLDRLEDKVMDVHDKVLNVNEQLVKTLEEDIFCLLILVGMIVVLVKLVQN